MGIILDLLFEAVEEAVITTPIKAAAAIEKLKGKSKNRKDVSKNENETEKKRP